jgi:hypothetical protein
MQDEKREKALWFVDTRGADTKVKNSSAFLLA